MKKTSKTLLSFLLAFGMILSMFAVTSATGWAADEHVPASATLVAYPKPATESLASLSSKVSGLKSSNKAVVTAKLSKSTYGTSQTYYTILAVPKKAGTATVSFKCQGKTYKIKVTVKKYVNPVKSVKIGATTVSGSRFKSSSETSLSYAKFAEKKVKTTVTLAMTTLGSDRASSKGYIVRWVEAPSNKLLTTAFEASLESVTVTCRLSVDSKIAGIAMEHRNPKVSEGRHRGQGGRQYMHLSLW